MPPLLPGPAPPHPKVHFFRSPAPIPISTSRGPGPRATHKPPMPPPPAPAPAPPAAAQAPPPPPAPAASNQQPPPPAAGASAMRPPRLPLPPSAADAMLQQRATPPSNDENNGREISLVKVKEETAEGHDKASTTAPVKISKRAKNLKASKQTMDASNGGNMEDPGPSYLSNHCRYDSSLSLLTKKFVSLLEGAEDGTIDLNKEAEMLEVRFIV
ncbi:hypothetical protein PVAP13_2NG537200 [Panicum virgatum]|uniref:Uncharacterized protein n=1 Tax=Panicum virgatum TaxID=38727 RepID=A0A8T0VRT9_PANVG|nr:hypothetical protein PVAP13_2NG537200 [Panicum virgatum]